MKRNARTGKKSGNRDVLFELRIENIPARFIMSAERQMADFLSAALREKNIPFSSIETCGTYKRLCAYIRDVSPKTEKKILKIKGPSAALLKGADDNYSPQVMGFCRSRGVKPENLFAEKTSRGEFLFALKKTGGEDIRKILPSLFGEMLLSLQFPKTMVWEETRFRFARPIRGIVALYGDGTIPVKAAGIRSSRITEGLSAEGFKPIKLARAEDYFSVLKNANVLVRDGERRDALLNGLKSAGRRMKAVVNIDGDLLDENLYLTEHPVPVSGDFSREFLRLPTELINLVMKKQLKFFTVRSEKGDLLPCFVGVRDGVSKGQKNIREGFKNVVEARFRDAIFFFEKDLAAGPDSRLPALEKTLFHAKIGLLSEKADRIRKIAGILADNLFPGENLKIAPALKYLFSDLPGHVVGEFPELEGIMGYYYLKAAGYSREEALPLREFREPVGMENPLPSSKGSLVISLAGKAENLLSFFAAGVAATGSQDPYGLRRSALGMARILIEKKLSLDLKDFFSAAAAYLPSDLEFGPDVSGNLLDFIWQRAEAVFEKSGFKFDEIRALKARFALVPDLFDAHRRMEAINSSRKKGGFKDFIVLFKRAKNILKQAKCDLSPAPDPRLFEKDAERKLHSAVRAFSERAETLIKSGKYSEYLGEALAVKPLVDGYFDDVMVMCGDRGKMENRLRTISGFVSLLESFADFSRIQEEI